MAEHRLGPEAVHHQWDRSLEPVVVVRSGHVLHLDLLMAGSGQVARESRSEDTRFDFDTLYNLAGPVLVEEAQPGDTLEVEVLDLVPGDWGWTAILPGLGLLPDDFPEPYLRVFDLTDTNHAELVPGVEIPIAPFLGTMGTHPGDDGSFAPFPPHRGGGNVDARHLRVGSKLWLPVWCPGALFSCGDPHAAQGDGEVCVSALECDMQATLRLRVSKRSIARPRFYAPSPLLATADGRGHLGTMGIAADLMEGARAAVREMIDVLVESYALTREDAYVLCSLAGDLKVLEVVDAGMWNVGFTLPLDVFTG
jgi:acetamidase/formamidase